MKLLVINGPNMNMLGIREPEIYGHATYADLVRYIKDICTQKNIQCEIFQSNHEGDIIDKIQDAYMISDAIVINPAAYSHTSIAIADAIKSVGLPAVEVHLSDITKREDFRKHSYTANVCIKTVTGKGFDGYKEAILLLKDAIDRC
ncbi:MAG TPA: type II 3-dehydroquinate dehydratase [Clostridia bacterium]|jgi:3-dehydroquinate dehydratase-2|nr:type II 3-dehydroquinate dehydratase [Clostridiaceae bacterium]HOF26807.1 type II 3-dehydroquinate dehydratase [Clostridia bacterium]HOM33872.1 type II 3-dehydroquinate dehydratase [Clostridia bacterium]HOR89870.1 type II 3-dehydroquinate dehydratase [Clostridia bacterium]HOT69946.1 type II 3-dehydroquinate dehydratase [Clostridia bacterium]